MITVICILLFAVLALIDLIFLMFLEIAGWLLDILSKLLGITNKKRRDNHEKMDSYFGSSSSDCADHDDNDTGRDWFEEIR